MFFFIGVGVVLVAVFGGYVANDGHLPALWQPFEFIIIVGAAIGAFIISNPQTVLKAVGKEFPKVFKGPKFGKPAFVELLVMLNVVFKLAKSKGAMALETHVENPEESSIFQQYPTFLHDHHAVDFFCDFFRMLIMGADNAHEMEALMDARIEVHHHESLEVSHAITGMADGMPALGIVAAVLGVIHTMGSITEPPEVLGHLIGGALVGTFLGVLISYGFVAPMAAKLKSVADAEVRYYICMKSGIIAYMQGYAPIMAVESARMVLLAHDQPSFADIEQAIDNAPAAA
ncbi:flagellar motor stator protein MotA [Aliidongia dinghuensis]|uniref:Flagellar motor stator protein MotA n=1 Tax=Aliidongia dinghuensis TaxID=1867774 RepID=A0A8J2YVJ8_9PROT|nr:flagellar motor stator protein MotA [Aliidongia dinghuensis]GGF27380.1 flagellar motor stator protein MotA [Aliidongia dinghuensis]